MKRFAAWLLAAAAGLGTAGCGGPALSRDEEVEMLRTKDLQLQEELLAAQHRIAELTAAGARPAAIPRPPEDPFRPVAVQFNRYTGLLAARTPAEERLKIVLEPLDAYGDVIKRAGSLDLEALVPDPAGQPPKPFHRWTLSTEDLAQTWLSGLGAYGYVMKFAWPGGRAPAGDRLLLRAKFTTVAGEVFTAETEVPLERPNPPQRLPPP